jgi:hypothetical protein
MTEKEYMDTVDLAVVRNALNVLQDGNFLSKPDKTLFMEARHKLILLRDMLAERTVIDDEGV